MIHVSTTNVQGFIYYFGIFYLKIGKFYTFFSIGKGAHDGPQNQPRKIPDHLGNKNAVFVEKGYFYNALKRYEKGWSEVI